MAPPPAGLAPEKLFYGLLLPVSTLHEAPLYHMAAPDGKDPEKGYITYQRVSTSFTHTLRNTCQFIVAYFQVDVYAPSIGKAAEIAHGIRYTCTGYRETPEPVPSINAHIVGVLPENEFTGYEWDEKLNRRTMMFKVMIREATTDEGGGGPLE